MALEVKVKSLGIARGRRARMEFRGETKYTRMLTLEEAEADIEVNEILLWQLESPLKFSEVMFIDVRGGKWGRKRSTRFYLHLEMVAMSPGKQLYFQLLSASNSADAVQVRYPYYQRGEASLEVRYTSPEMCPSFRGPEHSRTQPEPDTQQSEDDMSSDDSRVSEEEVLLVNAKKNTDKLEEEKLADINAPSTSKGAIPKTSRSNDSKRTPFKSFKDIWKFGKRSSSNCRSSTGDEVKFVSTRLVESDPEVDTDNPHQTASHNLLTLCDQRRRIIPNMHTISQSHLKAQDFQVCLTILEARQLAGLNMDPIVCIQVGDQKKYTSVKESTNCPYYNEYFVFDFHMPPIMLFDKIITLSVLQARNMFRPNKMLGSFKLDVATAWAQPDHQFYHKWAMLTDPSDPASGAKGYLKCDISIIGKGNTVNIPPKSERDEDDIETNLLLPDGVSMERQRARFVVRVHKADGLPKMNLSVMANMKKAFTGESRDLVDPYVQVCFAGLSGSTSVQNNSYNPVWNEQIIFTDMFPPLCQRIRVQLRNQDPVKPTVIGTHYVDLKLISSDDPSAGFMPTFGPAYVHLYGSPRDYTLLDQHADLNAGLGEGVSYRARVLLSVRTELTENPDAIPANVEVEPCPPPPDYCFANEEEFLLFATVLDATMIDKNLCEKPISFELSIGNFGNVIDGYNHSTRSSSQTHEIDHRTSVTPPMKAVSHDRMHYYIPYFDRKPCMCVKSKWPNHLRRMYISNLLERLYERLEEGLHNAAEAVEDDGVAILRATLNDLHHGCCRFLQLRRSSTLAGAVTELDKRRNELCLLKIATLSTKSRSLKANVTKSSYKDRYKTAQTFLTKLKFLIEDPQGTLPDVVIWAISGGKRLAYQRVLARHFIYSTIEEERGKLCGKPHTMFLRLPGKKADGSSGWMIPTKLFIYIWLGLKEHKPFHIDGLPGGYQICREILSIERLEVNPPTDLCYVEKHNFQLRAYIYQARSLIGSDASGLSDPFARVIVAEYCKTTRVIDATLSPTWDQSFVFSDITLYGSMDHIKLDPPIIIIEIFDQDQMGKSEFIGRAMAKPIVKSIDDPYVKPLFPPSLEWYEITRGLNHAGELLATFELLEIDRGDFGEPGQPPGVLPLSPALEGTDVIPVPEDIRPTLANYRIEVLFWGLRDLKRVHFLAVDKPKVYIECSGDALYSSVIQNAQKNSNFGCSVKFLDVELPEQELYRPPLTIRVVDCRSFGRYTLVGTHTINSIHNYMHTFQTAKEMEAEERRQSLLHKCDLDGDLFDFGITETKVQIEVEKENCPLLFKNNPLMYGTNTKIAKIRYKKMKTRGEEEDDDEESSKDWWSKYFASVDKAIEGGKEAKQDLQKMKNNDDKKNKQRAVASTSKAGTSFSPLHDKYKTINKSGICKIYPGELESQSEFEEFKDWLFTFDLYRGKKTEEDIEDENRIVGSFKGAIKVYRWPTNLLAEDRAALGFDPQFGVFQNMPSNEPIRVLVRVYIVKANDLHPMDLNGKADPYIVLQLGSKKISDKDNYISKQLNPVFGKCFEIEATFPRDAMLTVKIQDWDLVGSDDVIGETKIDLENRFYSKHRATCGLSRHYEEHGYNKWRDPMRPTQILAKLCKDSKINPPIYDSYRLRIGKKLFEMSAEEDSTLSWSAAAGRSREFEEKLALSVLHRWNEVTRVGCHLVPEHIETRPLYNPDKPGIERGKLEMWVDMFPMDLPPPGPPIDISPRKPESYELRVIIWNTDDVVLEDDAFFSGEKMSDIYVKGWLKGQEDCQSTDIHYRSLTGEGNFNWRFIYPFDYLVAEKKIVISRKESLFSWDETKSKIPARLELQVWDADHFSADDFLGAMTLDLNRFPRGAKSSKLCTLDMLKTDGSVPMVNIFKQRRVKGWWPFHIKNDNDELKLTGKVEAEFHLMTKEEAENYPAGMGRNEPDPLDRPNRPDASFMWIMNPLKSIRYIVWHNYKWKILKAIAIFGMTILFLLFFYAIPGYSVKRFLGA
ncbi:ferlin family C2 domain-containing myoferlin misfire [Arctopsyche grandis]|uniref:ferlin family C2 domain-containing myoferlin misfire n=1 Tax=Arctopsyche grandis TaxID=121162 RepID=UPI00406D77E8